MFVAAIIQSIYLVVSVIHGNPYRFVYQWPFELVAQIFVLISFVLLAIFQWHEITLFNHSGWILGSLQMAMTCKIWMIGFKVTPLVVHSILERCKWVVAKCKSINEYVSELNGSSRNVSLSTNK